MTTDLDELERLHAATVQGEWKACTTCTERNSGCRIVWSPDGNSTIFEQGDGEECATTGSPADAAFVAASHNAMPALIAELRALREVAAAARIIDESDWNMSGLEVSQDTLDKLRAALAKVPR